MISILTMDRRRPMKDGRYPIKVKVGFGTALLIGTGVSCYEKEWSERAKLYSGPNAAEVNGLLSSKLSEVVTRVLELQRNGRLPAMEDAQVRAYIEKGSRRRQGRQDFETVAEECIRAKRRADGTIQSMRQTIARVRDYAGGPVFLDDMTSTWLSGLERHIGGRINSVAVHMRNIRTVFNYALDEEYTKCYPFRKYQIRTEATRDRSLSVDELRRIFSYPCDDWQREYVDIFKLTFFLCGINMKDLAALECITGGRVEYNRAKTGIHCSVAVQPEALEIIERYRGEGQLLSILDRYRSHADYLSHFNSGLQSLGTHWSNGERRTGRPLFPMISSYWARYSWASVAAEIDVPVDTIGAALGHSRGRSVTAIYIRTDMRRKVDEANRRVIDYVLYGKR